MTQRRLHRCAAIDSSPTAALVTNASGMAIDSRRPPAGAIIPL